MLLNDNNFLCTVYTILIINRSLFLGQVDVSRCLTEYLAAAEILIEYCKSLGDSVPIIVNTMGFNTGKIDQISNAGESI
jgi:hypothetical protein